MNEIYRLVILRLHRDHQPGTAVVCLEARYASVLWPGADRIDRRFGTPGTWRDVIAQLAHVAVGAKIERSSAVAQLLAGDEARSVEMTCVDLLTIQVAPGCLAPSLDEILHEAATPTLNTVVPQLRLALETERRDP